MTTEVAEIVFEFANIPICNIDNDFPPNILAACDFGGYHRGKL